MKTLQVVVIVVRLVAAAMLLVIVSLLHSTIDASAQRLEAVGNEAIAFRETEPQRSLNGSSVPVGPFRQRWQVEAIRGRPTLAGYLLAEAGA